MLPAGEITEQTVAELGRLLEPGDTIIDGGNAFFQDEVRRAPRDEGQRHPLSSTADQRRRLGPGARALA